MEFLWGLFFRKSHEPQITAHSLSSSLSQPYRKELPVKRIVKAVVAFLAFVLVYLGIVEVFEWEDVYVGPPREKEK